jgi:hypothetical protein
MAGVGDNTSGQVTGPAIPVRRTHGGPAEEVQDEERDEVCGLQQSV